MSIFGVACPDCAGSGRDIIPMVGETTCLSCGGTGRTNEPQAWPSSTDLAHVYHGKHRYYRFQDGSHPDLPGATTVLKASLGLSTEPLIAWAARVEREACLGAADEIYSEHLANQAAWRSPVGFRGAVESKLGIMRQHQKMLEKAGDIGSQIHARVQSWLEDQLTGQQELLPTNGAPEVNVAFLAFKDRWRDSGLKPVRMEQPVYDLDLGYAGTIDVVAECPQRGLGVVDLKSSKGVYPEMHLQVASYLRAGRNFADLKWGEVWRLPKSIDNLAVEVVPLGNLWDREASEDDLLAVFQASLTVFNVLLAKEDA